MKLALLLLGFSERSAIIVLAVAMPITYMALPAWAYGAGPHVHGAATLDIAIDDASVQVYLNSPLQNLLGFEHTPRNEKEHQAVTAMASRLHQTESLFIFTPPAQCRLESARLESPLLPMELLTPGSGSKVEKPSGDKSPTPSPAPSPTTAPPAAPSGKLTDEHAELEVTWSFRCAVPPALQGVDVRLFQAFPGLRRIDAAIAGPKGQSSAKLSPASTRLKW